MILALLLFAASQDDPFPERTPAMIEACLEEAVAGDLVGDDDGRLKYMCSGDAAQALWSFLSQAGVKAWEQDVGAEGVWSTRNFPLGACFRRLRKADGSAATNGLSCSIWVPRARSAAAPTIPAPN